MDLQELMKQAAAMQARMQELQGRVALIEATGMSGGGLVKVTVNGKGETRSISIDSSLLVPAEQSILEDLIVAACNDARARVDAVMQQEMARMTADLNLPPGMKPPGF